LIRDGRKNRANKHDYPRDDDKRIKLLLVLHIVIVIVIVVGRCSSGSLEKLTHTRALYTYFSSAEQTRSQLLIYVPHTHTHTPYNIYIPMCRLGGGYRGRCKQQVYIPLIPVLLFIQYDRGGAAQVCSRRWLQGRRGGGGIGNIASSCCVRAFKYIRRRRPFLFFFSLFVCPLASACLLPIYILCTVCSVVYTQRITLISVS